MKPIPAEASGWQFNPEACPDQDFIEYLETSERPTPAVIFHMGPGMNHMVGRWAASQKNVYVRAISLSPAEVDAYIQLAIQNPILNTKYAVDFGDIHLLTTQLLPRIDYITLFHLGEVSSQLADPEYPGNSIADTIALLARRMAKNGQMLFCADSPAWKDIKGAVEVNMVYRYEYERSVFKSLIIYKKVRA